MLFKSDRIEAEFDGAPVPDGTTVIAAKLKALVSEIADYALAVFDWELTLTCLLRTPEENDEQYGGHGDHLSGVHVVGRGADVRISDQPPENARTLASWINGRWTYDPARPTFKVALVEGSAPGAGSSAQHLHIQISPSTVGGTA